MANNSNNEMKEMAENFLAVPGMENLIVEMLTPKIVDKLQDYGIKPNENPTNNQQYTEQNPPLNFAQNIPPTPVNPLPPVNTPEIQQKQSLDANQLIGLVQALLPVIGPALGLTSQNQNQDNNGLNQALQTYGQIETIKVQAQNNLLENLTMLTGTLTNRTDRDPAEVLGELAQVNLNNKPNETK